MFGIVKVINKTFRGGFIMSEKKRKKPIFKRWWFWVIIIIFAIGILGSGGDDTKEPKKAEEPNVNVASQDKSNEAEEPTPEPEVIYQIGDSFDTGDLGVTILEVEEKTEFTSDNQFIDSVSTEGKFIAVTAKLTNNDTKARTFSSMQFKIIDEQDREFDASTDFNLMMILGDDDIFLKESNPGMSRTGVFVFEVPEDIETYWLKVYSGVGFAAKTSETVKLK